MAETDKNEDTIPIFQTVVTPQVKEEEVFKDIIKRTRNEYNSMLLDEAKEKKQELAKNIEELERQIASVETMIELSTNVEKMLAETKRINDRMTAFNNSLQQIRDDLSSLKEDKE